MSVSDGRAACSLAQQVQLIKKSVFLVALIAGTYNTDEFDFVLACEYGDWDLVHCKREPHRRQVVLVSELVTQLNDHVAVLLSNSPLRHGEDCFHVLLDYLTPTACKELLHLYLLGCIFALQALIQVSGHVFCQLD